MDDRDELVARLERIEAKLDLLLEAIEDYPDYDLETLFVPDGSDDEDDDWDDEDEEESTR